MSEQDKGGVYDVEELLSRRVRMGRIEYKVHWRGYNKESDHTWESTENLKECWEMVQEFEKKRLNRKSKPSGRRITRSLTKRGRGATSSPIASSPVHKRRSMGGASADHTSLPSTSTPNHHHHRRSLNFTPSARPNYRSKQLQPSTSTPTTTTTTAAAAGNSVTVAGGKKNKKAQKDGKERPPTCVIDLTLEEEDEGPPATTTAAATAETSRTAATAASAASNGVGSEPSSPSSATSSVREPAEKPMGKPPSSSVSARNYSKPKLRNKRKLKSVSDAALLTTTAIRVLPAKTERKTPSNDRPTSSPCENVVKQLRSSALTSAASSSSTPSLTCKQKQAVSTTATSGSGEVKVNGLPTPSLPPAPSSSATLTKTDPPPASEKEAEKKAQDGNNQQQHGATELKHPLDDNCSSRKKRQPTAHRVTNSDGSLVKICYKNQDCGNALDPQGIKDLIRKLDEVRKSSCVKVVLLHTIGEVFCSGLNVYEMRNRIKSNKDQRRIAKTFANAVKDLMDTLIKYPKILVAQVQGPAYGLGLVILTLFDFVYASEEATFSAPYLKMGQIAEGCAAVSLPLAVGKYVANEIMLAGRLLRAEEAKNCGLVSRVYENDKFHENVITAIHDYLSIDLKLLLKQRSIMRGDNYERDLLQASSSNVPELIKSWLSSTFLENIAVVDLNVYLLPESKRSQYRTPPSALNKLRRLLH